MSIDIYEPIFQQDIEAEEEYAIQGWKVFYTFYNRLGTQGAPPELLARVVEINNLYRDLAEKISAIHPCFPKEQER
jgi:hypothetical protein